ncbi:hypothetical protein LTR93_011597 [Exophiala xenobiotica]|nr:hypothetical protein LTR93_011597 [Exophiala xenobiotica]
MAHLSQPSYSLQPEPSMSNEATPRVGSPDSMIDRNGFNPEKSANPFLTPYASQDPSRNTSSAALNQGIATQRYFHSRRVKKGEVERPWTKVKGPKEKWVTIIPMIGMLAGFALAGYLIWDGLQTVVNHKYCPVYLSGFPNKGWESDIWTKEAEVGRFGNGQFEETTVMTENVFIQNGMLHIKPTLQDPNLIEKDSVASRGNLHIFTLGQLHHRHKHHKWHHRKPSQVRGESTRNMVLYTNFGKEGLWARGHFPEANSNGTKYVDPWSQTGRALTLFDQDFYLILNVAVGETNG